MSEEPPDFLAAARLVKEKIASLTSSPVRIMIYNRLTPRILGEIMRLEKAGFREELQYTQGEIIERSHRSGFTAIIPESPNGALAFFFGNDDPDLPGGFYGDSLVSSAEGKGLGGSLFALVHLYCYHAGYTHFSCHAETVDEKGRRLREWYEAAGMHLVSSNSEEGDLLRVELTKEHTAWIYRRFILGEKQPAPRRSP
jgi:hypothetical protein